MRLSMDRDDPGWIGEENFGRFKVTVDGFSVRAAVEVDDQAGYVVAIAYDDRGNVILNEARTDVEKVTHRGLIRIIDTRA